MNFTAPMLAQIKRWVDADPAVLNREARIAKRNKNKTLQLKAAEKEGVKLYGEMRQLEIDLRKKTLLFRKLAAKIHWDQSRMNRSIQRQCIKLGECRAKIWQKHKQEFIDMDEARRNTARKRGEI